MNLALWRKAVSDAWKQLLFSCALLIAFTWVFMWWMSQIPTNQFAVMLKLLPHFIKSLITVPIDELATRSGQLTILYVHVVTIFLCVGWAVGRGSDSISGEIARGTMDLLLTLPVRRAWVMAIPAVVAAAGAAMLPASIMCGIFIGLHTLDFGENISVWKYLPGSINLFALIFCLTGITVFISSWNRDRWRVVALSAGFFIVSYIVEIARRVWHAVDFVKYFNVLSVYQPQDLILPAKPPQFSAPWCDATLLALGLLAFVLAGAIISRRDIPAAL
jgi:ABC-2 type transport system permease protein